MVAWWTGDDTAKDLIGPNDGQLLNGAAYAPGKVGSGFLLNGGNSAVQVPDSPAWDFGTGDFTIDTWVNLTPQLDNPMLPGPQVLVAHDEGPGNIPKWMFWIIEREGTSRLEFYSYPSEAVINVPWDPTPGQWNHVAVSRSGSTFTFYVNGSDIGTRTYAGSVDDANAPLTLGFAETNISLDGILDEVEIFNRALSQSEIQGIFNADSAGKCKVGVHSTAAGYACVVAGRREC